MDKSYIKIKPTTDSDFAELWKIFQHVISTGDSFVYSTDTSKATFRKIWFGVNIQTYTAFHNGHIVGSYIIQPNFPDLGAHVANTSYMVSPQAQGIGVGKAMGQHSILRGKEIGYLAIQLNMVVSTNLAALKLWQSLGFKIIGTSPKAFNHSKLGYVDAHIMHIALSRNHTPA